MRYALFIILTLAVFISGCKKEKADTEAICRVVKMVRFLNDTSIFTYDAQKRITKYQSPNYVVDIVYSGLTATSTTTYLGTVSPFLNIFLNSNGTVQAMNYDRIISGTNYHYTFSFKYDSENHLVWCEQTARNETTYTTDYILDSMLYVNGNMTTQYMLRRVHPATTYTLYETTVFTYTADLNKAGYFILRHEGEPIDMGSSWEYLYPLFGTCSKNIPAVCRVYNSGGTQAYEIDYTVSLNADGYPAEENMHAIVPPPDSPFTENRTFEYVCD